MAKLWQASGTQADKLVEIYTAADDAILDNRLVDMDIYTNAAHVRMLAARGYMSDEEMRQVIQQLTAIQKMYHDGSFVVEPQDEDVHTKIENYVTEQIGEPGRKIHTGRSRNDQVLSDMRLYMRSGLFELCGQVVSLASNVLRFAEQHVTVPMPGYTHMQRAMPSSVGLWGGAFVESLKDDVACLLGIAEYVDASPLGSGAGYGISLKIDREMTTDLLGFGRVQLNPIYCQNSRGKFEGMVLAGLSNIMMTLGRIASDLLLYTTSEYAFLKVAPQFTTGSSIMPQKKNLDIMELLRARVRTVLQNEALVKSIPVSLPSGYSRDLQETKKPIIESFEITMQSVEIVSALFGGLSVDASRMESALSPDIYATDEVFRMVDEGVPFRDAYRDVKERISALTDVDAAVVISKDATPGTPAQPCLQELEHVLSSMGKQAQKKSTVINEKLAKLLQL